MEAADEALELRDNEGNDSKQTSMHCRPTTSYSSHLLKGVYLGVSIPMRTQKSLKLQGVSS